MGFWGEVEIVQNYQSIAENLSNCYANFYACADNKENSFSGYSSNAELKLDTVAQNITIDSFNFGSSKRILLGQVSADIVHAPDGKKIAYASFRWVSGHSRVGTITGSASLKLTDIPRTSRVSCNSFNIGDATTIVISRASDSFTHTVTWAFGNASRTIATKTSATTIGATIPASSLYAQIPNSKFGVGTITCYTYSGDKLIGTSTCDFTAYAKESECIPIVSASIVDTNDTTISLTGSNTKFIKGFSNAKVTASATAKNSASISSYLTSCGDGRTSNTAVTQFNNINSKYISVKATDSRGYPKSVDYTLDWIEYIRLAFTSITVKRPESTADKANMTIKGNYFNNSFGNVLNNLILQYRYKEGSGEYTGWTALTPTITDNTFTYTELLENLDHNKKYTFEFMIDDELMTVYSEPVVLTKGIPVLRVGKDYVDISGTLKENGKNVITDKKFFSGSCNDIKETCVVWVANGQDCPTDIVTGYYGFLFTKYIDDNYIEQEFADANSTKRYTRSKIGGTWCDWTKIVLQPDIITVALQDNLSCSVVGSYARITGLIQMLKIGSKLMLSDNKIIIGAGVRKIKINAKITWYAAYATTDPVKYLWIYKNDSVGLAWSTISVQSETYISDAIPEFIVDVNEGDYIDMMYYTAESGASLQSSMRTYITVEVVE